MKTILVPTDLSPEANAALPVAIRLAHQYGAGVRVFHYLTTALVDVSLVEAADPIARYLDEQNAEAERNLSELCTRYQTPDVPVTYVLSHNEKGMYKAVTDEDVWLVVLSSHGTSGLAEWIIGSNAEHFVQTADCPVLVLKQAQSDFTPKKVLFAIDADDRLNTRFTYPFASDDTHYTFLFVETPHDPRVKEGIRAWVDELAAARQLPNYSLTINHHRQTHEGIIQFAEVNQFDLIVLFTSQRTGLWHFLNGSVTEDVVNHSPIPVLAIPLTGKAA